jgi:hypothetical protein
MLDDVRRQWSAFETMDQKTLRGDKYHNLKNASKSVALLPQFVTYDGKVQRYCIPEKQKQIARSSRPTR